jgi:CRISPR-associated endonuclease/helicase Cas3
VIPLASHWGKTSGTRLHLLPYHCLDVAACAQALLDGRPALRDTLAKVTGLTEHELRRWVGFFASVHDLGKASDAFQGQVSWAAQRLGRAPTLPYTVRHDSLGWAAWLELPLSTPTTDVWARAATGHHGAPPSRRKGGTLVRARQHFTAADLADVAGWVDWSRQHFALDLSLGAVPAFESASYLLAGTFTIADWVGSNRDWFRYVEAPVDLHRYWEHAQSAAQRAVSRAGLFEQPVVYRRFAELFPTYTPSPVQEACDQLATDEPFFLVVEDQTGSGKTEAAFTVAGDRFFFGLPTMATANGLWARVESLPGGYRTLAHGKRWLVPDAMRHATAWLNDSSRQALLAPIGVGTVDQVLLAVLYAKHNALRLVGLVGRTLVVDEVHAYDPYQREVLCTLIERHASTGGSVVLLSATMPLAHREQYVRAWTAGHRVTAPVLRTTDYPLVTHVTTAGAQEIASTAAAGRRVEVEWVHAPAQAVTRVALAAWEGQCVAWVCNTVREAVEAYDLLTAAGVDADLFHARFITAHRAAIERRVLQRADKRSTPTQRRGYVLVATQVIEQSLDLDFDLMITDLAPMDLLVQRAGRVHRHRRGERGSPTLVVHAPVWMAAPTADWIDAWSGGTARVYPDHGRLWLTMRELRARGALVTPQQSRELVEAVYGRDVAASIPAGLAQRTADAARRALRDAGVATLNTVPAQAAYEADGQPRWDDERAPTRLGEPSQEWVLVSNGRPLGGSVPASVVSLRGSLLAEAPGDSRVQVGPWQRTLDITAQPVVGRRLGGREVLVSYDSGRGLVVG